MELFAMRRSDFDPSVDLTSISQTDTFQFNFNTFFNSFIIIFTVLPGGSWDDTMFQFARTHGYYSIAFFVSL